MKLLIDDVVVRVLDLPEKIHGHAVASPDGVYNVYINAKQSYDCQCETYQHEVAHCAKDDFYAGGKLADVERSNT